MNIIKATKASFLLTLLILTTISSLTEATRSNPTSKGTKAKGGGGGGNSGGGDFFGPGGGFGIPGFNDPGMFGGGGGYGYGYGSPSGGHAKSGTVRSSVVCKEKGPCYMKKLMCPAKCFYSFSGAGKGYGGGGGGGGCTIDCKKKCSAYC